MDKELSEAINNINERFNNIDERFNQTCAKIDNYKARKEREIIASIIGSPIIVLIFTWLTSL